MSIKSGYCKSTDRSSIEDPHINETLINKMSKILLLVLEENKKLKNYQEKILA